MNHRSSLGLNNLSLLAHLFLFLFPEPCCYIPIIQPFCFNFEFLVWVLLLNFKCHAVAATAWFALVCPLSLWVFPCWEAPFPLALLRAGVAHWGELQAIPAWGAPTLRYSECTYHHTLQTVGFVALWTWGFSWAVRNYCTTQLNGLPYPSLSPLRFQLKWGVIVNHKTNEAWGDPWKPKTKFFSSLFFRFGLYGCRLFSLLLSISTSHLMLRACFTGQLCPGVFYQVTRGKLLQTVADLRKVHFLFLSLVGTLDIIGKNL